MASITIHNIKKITVKEIRNSTTATNGVRTIVIEAEEGDFAIDMFGEKKDLRINLTENKTI